jgi:glycerol-3-phosphate dehydrogenase subunit B
MHYDLIVIGMGLSGLMAAKTAAEMGKKVLIAGKGTGSLCLFSNTIDLLGIAPSKTEIGDGVSKWIKAHPEHPYSKLGWERMSEALSSFISLFPHSYSFQTMRNENYFIPTGAGTRRPTYLIPITMAAGASLQEGNGLIVGFKGFKDFFANYVASQLKCRGITLSFAETPHQQMTATALARMMEKESFRKAIGREIKKELQGETSAGFPALLGLRNPLQVKNDLEEIIGTKVFEIPILPPSIPGMRIFNRFKEWLIQKGVTFLIGHSISKPNLKGKRCEEVYVHKPPISDSYSADRYILATGRFVGGGLFADEEKIYEPVFNLPISQPKSREDWFRNSFFDNHPIHQAGISTDPSFRPIDERGNLVLENVWVAGTMLAHHRCIDEKSREGIEISTGYWAAKSALGR